MLRVALACHNLYPTPGGAERYTHNLATHLASLGCDVHVFTSDRNFREDACERRYAVHWVEAWRPLGYPVPRLYALRRLAEVDPQVIHTNGPHPYSDCFALMAKLLRKPCVMMHHAPLNPQSPIKTLMAKIERATFTSLYDAIIVSSELNRKRLQKAYPNERIYTVPLGIDETFHSTEISKEEAREKLNISENSKILLFVGRLDRSHYYKGLDLLLKAMLWVPHQIRLFVVGTGELRSYYEAVAMRLGIGDRVRFVGFIPDEELVLYYLASDLLVLPSTSTSEGFGLVLLEAMLLGTPTMTTCKAGSARLLEREKVAFVLHDLKPETLAEEIINALKDEEARGEIIRNARRFASKFTWSKSARDTLTVYKQILKRE